MVAGIFFLNSSLPFSARTENVFTSLIAESLLELLRERLDRPDFAELSDSWALEQLPIDSNLLLPLRRCVIFLLSMSGLLSL